MFDPRGGYLRVGLPPRPQYPTTLASCLSPRRVSCSLHPPVEFAPRVFEEVRSSDLSFSP